MRDIVAEFIDDYNEGRITLQDLQRRLSFDQWTTDRKAVRLIDYTPDLRTPEDIVLAKYDYIALYDCLEKLKDKVSESTWKILCMVAYGFTQEAIAERLSIQQPAISKRINRVLPIAQALGLKPLLEAVIQWQKG